MTARDAASGRLDRALARVAGAPFALPAGAVQKLAGPPREVDGQTLDPQMQLVLRLVQLRGDRPTAELTPAQARAQMEQQAATVAGPVTPVARVVDLTVAGAAGPRAARWYQPTGWRPPGPAMVWLHGGGWMVGSVASHDALCRLLAERSGVGVLAVDYRLAPEHPFPAAVDDAAAAFTDVVARAGELGLDPARVGVGGDSAGGHLAATVAMASPADGASPAFAVLVYPAVDMSRRHPSRDLFAHGYFLEDESMERYADAFAPPGVDRADPRVSPLLAADEVLAGFPPTYVVTAGFDPLRDEGEAFARRLRELGVPAVLRRHPGLLHGALSMLVVPVGRDAAVELAGALSVVTVPTGPGGGR